MLLCSRVLWRLLEPHRPPLLGYHTGPGGTRGRRQVLVRSPRFCASVCSRRHNSSRGELTARGGQRESTLRVSTVSAAAARRVPLAGPRIAGRAQGDGAAPSTLSEPPAPAPRPPHARARTAFPIGLSGAAVRALEARAPPRPRGRAPARPHQCARRAAEPLKGGRRRGRARGRWRAWATCCACWLCCCAGPRAPGYPDPISAARRNPSSVRRPGTTARTHSGWGRASMRGSPRSCHCSGEVCGSPTPAVSHQNSLGWVP